MLLQKFWRAYRPPWFQGPNVNIFYESVGALHDLIAQRVLDGRLAANPWAGPGVGIEEPVTATGQRIECQPDALPWISRDRGIPLYTTEGLLSQRQRLAAFRQLRAARSTHWGEMEHVRPYFSDAVALGYAYPRFTIVFQDGLTPTPGALWYSMAPDGSRTITRTAPSNMDYDGLIKRTRWWVFIDMTGTGYTPPALWGGGWTWGDGTLWGSAGTRPFTAQAGFDIAQMFVNWHAAHSWLNGVIVVWPGVGGAAFPSATTTPTQDASGWWSLPNGPNTWASIVLPDGRASRPPNFQWLLDNPAP